MCLPTGYFVFGHDAPRQVRCGKWLWPVTAGQGCAYRLLFAGKINEAVLYLAAVRNHLRHAAGHVRGAARRSGCGSGVALRSQLR